MLCETLRASLTSVGLYSVCLSVWGGVQIALWQTFSKVFSKFAGGGESAKVGSKVGHTFITRADVLTRYPHTRGRSLLFLRRRAPKFRGSRGVAGSRLFTIAFILGTETPLHLAREIHWAPQCKPIPALCALSAGLSQRGLCLRCHRIQRRASVCLRS